MKTNAPVLKGQRIRCFTLIALGCFLGKDVYAGEPIPVLSSISVESNSVDLEISNIATGGTYYIESSDDLKTNNWVEIGSFEGITGSNNWYGAVDGSATSVFYRVNRDPYHPKVGEVATFINHYHGISGTAHIVNNRILELRNFYYDGTGIEVVVWLSAYPPPGLFPGTAVSGDLRKPSPGYVDEILTFTLPDGFDLNSAAYISIWCIDIPVSFGDGMFQ